VTLALLLVLFQSEPQDTQFFEQKIRPVLVDKCYSCHSAKAEKLKGDLRLDTRDGTRKGGESGPAIVPGDPEASLLIRAIRRTDLELKMPPREKLDPQAIADFETWVKRGAADPRSGPATPAKGPLWSLEPLRTSTLTSIDDFIRAKLKDAGLAPSPPADKRTLLRRATIDLTGLPPSTGEIDAFLADASPDAFAKLVDRLLASPAYGERWGRHWLDAVHYGETHGYDKDKPRRHAWPYRDYVIRSFNDDKPYSRFVEEQLAGDVLHPGSEGIIATGFIAAGPWDFVGHAELPETKTDGLIARYNDRDDMLMTTISTFQSLTVHCARCHDHKFDPIPTDDYYALQAVFAGVDRADRATDADPAVTAKRKALEAERQRLAPGRGRPSPSNGYHSAIERRPDVTKWVEVDLGKALPIDEIRLVPARPTDFADTPGFGFPPRYSLELDSATLVVAAGGNPGDAPVAYSVGGREARVVRVTATRLWERTQDYVFALAELQVISRGVNVAAGATVAALDSIEAGRWSRKYLVDGFDSRAALPVAPTERLREVERELASLPQAQLVYAAASDFTPYGAFAPAKTPRPVHVLIRGDVRRPAKPAVPGALGCVPGLESRFDAKDEGARRAALAKWITDPLNVLTRRSIVNRVWHYHFGRGIVETPNDFGHMGSPPSHPELLDWLARRFLDDGESIKKLHRLILLSATWQQSSRSNPESARIDGDNRLLWRMSRARLDAESFHDALLAASGTLDRTMGGPSVEQFYFKDDHSPVYDYTRADSDSAGARRRSVYRFIVRSVPDPFMDALDGVDASILTPRRNTTLTALQALATMNDPFVLKQCEHLAARAKTASEAVRLALGRPALPEEEKKLSEYAARHGLANVCRLLINSNEFWFVD
jgi:hypothetical protein